jgi:threonine/homoserine/homoserine lactone efflux protein
VIGTDMMHAGIDTAAVLAVAAIYALGVIIPGPNFVAVTHTAVSASRIEALALVAGIVLSGRAAHCWASARCSCGFRWSGSASRRRARCI